MDDDGISIEIMFLMHVIMQTRNEKYIIRRIERKQKSDSDVPITSLHMFQTLYWTIYYKLSPNYIGIYNNISVLFENGTKTGSEKQ